MGGLRLLITGANGFLGRACVAAALARGHSVRALTRSTVAFADGVEAVQGDLAEGCDAAWLEGIDAVLHTAASVSNRPDALARDTEAASARLFAAVAQAQGQAQAQGPADARLRVVLASSIVVYDADAQGAICEDTPLETRPQRREAYVGAKLAQEAALRACGGPGWCLRLGAIYDSTRRWNAHIGLKRGALLISLGRAGDVPLIHLSDAAEAMIRAAETAPNGQCEALNIVENPLPSRAAFVAMAHRGPNFRLHWRLLLPLAWLCEALLGARAPGLLRPRILRARLQAHSYSNARAVARLGWHPAQRFCGAGL